MAGQVIIHIGGEKTGTTTLQFFLARNSERLARVGFSYPTGDEKAYCSANAHFPVAACLLERDIEFIPPEKKALLPTVLKNLGNDIRDTEDTVIISCEHFSSRIHEQAQLVKLRDALRDKDVKVLFYLREPSELLLASYSTAIQSGRKHNFNINEINADNSYYNHLTTLTLWGSVFGEENILARQYGALFDGDICKDFCEVVGLDYDTLAPEEARNVSLDGGKLDVLRFLNLALPNFSEAPEEWPKSQRVRALISKYLPSGRPLKTIISRADKQVIREKFLEVNREIDRRYLNGEMSDEWFPSDQKSFPVETASLAVETGPEETALAGALRVAIIALANDFLRQRGVEAKVAEARTAAKEKDAKIAELERKLREIEQNESERNPREAKSNKGFRRALRLVGFRGSRASSR